MIIMPMYEGRQKGVEGWKKRKREEEREREKRYRGIERE